MDINTHLEKIVALNLDYVNGNLVPLIPNQYAQVGVKEIIERLNLTVVALANGSNDLTSIWNTLPNDPEILEALRGLLKELVSSITNEDLKQSLDSLIEPLVLTISALTDTVKPDDTQIKKIWNDFVQSPEFLGFALVALGFILNRYVKNEKTRKFISNLLTTFIK